MIGESVTRWVFILANARPKTNMSTNEKDFFPAASKKNVGVIYKAVISLSRSSIGDFIQGTYMYFFIGVGPFLSMLSFSS